MAIVDQVEVKAPHSPSMFMKTLMLEEIVQELYLPYKQQQIMHDFLNY